MNYFEAPEKYRVTTGLYGTHSDDGNNGIFVVPLSSQSHAYCIVSDGLDWEHVSVHIFNPNDKTQRTPTWSEMCKIKDLFWNEFACVVQYHPEKNDYVNNHKHTLHLWRPIKQIIVKPPKYLV